MFVPCLASRCKSLRLTTVRSLAAKYENMRLPDFLVPRDRGTSSQNELSADAWSGNLANRRSFKCSLLQVFRIHLIFPELIRMTFRSGNFNI